MSKSDSGYQLTWGGSFALTYFFAVIALCLHGATSVLDTALLKVASISALLLLASAAYLRSWRLALVVIGWLGIFLAFGGTVVLTNMDQPSPQPSADQMQAMLNSLQDAVLMIPYIATAGLVLVALVSCALAAHQLFRRRRSV